MTKRNGNARSGAWQHSKIRASKNHAHRCKEIEDLTRHRVSIKASTASTGQINKQKASDFMRIQPELRVEIYKLVLNDRNVKELGNAADGGPALYASLLLTCRLIWLETSKIAMDMITHEFNFARGPRNALSAATNARYQYDRHNRHTSACLKRKASGCKAFLHL
jgi:hypothetical protein